MKEMLKKYRLPIIITVVLLIAALTVGVVLLVGKLNRVNDRNEMIETLVSHDGEYNKRNIMLTDTSRPEAEALAEKYGAELRMSGNERFAVLQLPEDKTILDVYGDDNNLRDLSKFSVDWHVKLDSVDQEDEEKTDSVYVTSRPRFDVTDDLYDNQTYLDYINMQDVWSVTKGEGITVAVIDTGLDVSHSEFKGRVSEWSYYVTEDKIVKDYLLDENDPTSYDWSIIDDQPWAKGGHGTAVTGVIAAAMDGKGITGIAPEVNILVIKARADYVGEFVYSSDLILGIYYAIERDADVINMSFGACGCDVKNSGGFKQVLQLAVDSDVICVASAGNCSSSQWCFPAADPNCIGVGALESDGWSLASYSNYGVNTDIVAPGSTLTTCMENSYEDSQGTSLSAPIVTGVVALYLSQHKNEYLEYKDVKEVVLAAGRDIGDPGPDFYYGYGCIDASALVLEKKGNVTFNYLTDEIAQTKQVFVRNHTLQAMPEPDRLYAVFDGWYYDDQCIDEVELYSDKFSSDLTLYAKWINEDDGIPYIYDVLSDGTVEIRSYTGHRRFITIPEYIDGKPVVSVGDTAFLGNTNLRQVNLPSQLRTIGDAAFKGCTSLSGIKIPDSVVSIGIAAFADDIRLSYVSFTEKSCLHIIANTAFKNCVNLQNFYVPKNVVQVSGTSFFGCTSMLSFDVDKANKSLRSDDGVIFSASKLYIIAYPAGRAGEYSIPEMTRVIDSAAFAYSKIKQIDLSNITWICNQAFYYSSLRSVDIPDSVVSLGKSAFENNCLSSIRIGHGLTEIKEKCFAISSSAVDELIIPNTIQTIGKKAFMSLSISKLVFEENSTLMFIGSSAFSLNYMTELDIPDSVITISDSAFVMCSLLSQLRFTENSSLSVIGINTFSGAKSLKQVEFPNKLTVIDDFAFYNTGLEGDVIIPASVDTLGAGAFGLCKDLVNIKIEDGNRVYKDIDGVVYTIDGKTLVEYPIGKDDKEYNVPEGVETIGRDAFLKDENLENINLPETLIHIGKESFFGCIGIRSINIPNKVLTIGDKAFAETYNLEHIYIRPESRLSNISFQAFAFSGITEFTVPASVSRLAGSVFDGCSELYQVVFAENSRLDRIAAYMFKDCDKLSFIRFGKGSCLTTLQAHAFDGVKSLLNIDFGDAPLTEIGNYAFKSCTMLYDVTIPEGVLRIGRYAFYDCTNLREIHIPSSVVFIGRYAFLQTVDCTVYFALNSLPETLQEDWDRGLTGYIVGAAEIYENDEWKYAILSDNTVALLKYKGTAAELDLTNTGLGDVSQISGECFVGAQIENVILPDTLKIIQRKAFFSTPLKSVTIPASVTFIGNNAFAHTLISSLTFAENSRINSIEYSAFEKTKDLKSVRIPKSLESMGRNVFMGSGLETLTFEENTNLAEIPAGAFAGTDLKQVVIPEGVTYIRSGAFRDIKELESVQFPKNDEIRLESYAFYDCGLKTVDIPENMVYIGEYAFISLCDLNAYNVAENNPYYKSVDGVLFHKLSNKLIAFPAGKTGGYTVPAYTESIGFGAFESSALTEVLFEDGINLLTIGCRAFMKADKIKQITIPSTVVSIDYYAFAYADSLEKVVISEDNKMTGIYEGAFYGCTSLTDIMLPDTVVEISDYAFCNCRSLVRLPVSENSGLLGIYGYAMAYTGLTGELVLPDGLQDIGERAFAFTNITKAVVPDKNAEIIEIGLGVFESCDDIKEITLPFVGAYFNTVNDRSWFGYIFGAASERVINEYFPKNLSYIKITGKITILGINAFMGCYGNSKIDLHLPDTIESVYRGALTGDIRFELHNPVTLYYEINGEGKKVLEEELSADYLGGVYGTLKINPGIKYIHNGYHFVDLDELYLPEGLLSIWDDTFTESYWSFDVRKVHIPSTVTYISPYAFNTANITEDFVIAEGNTKYYVENGILYERDPLKILCSFPKMMKGDIIIPDEITKLPDRVFANCKLLTKFTVPSQITYIGKEAFINCTALEEVILPEGLKTIEYGTFTDCVSLEKIYLPTSLTSIERDAFKGAVSLVSLTIPGSVTSIGNGAFCGDASLTSVTIPDNVKTMGIGVFENCTGLETAYIGSGLTELPGSIFKSCESLKNVTLGSSVITIGEMAFDHCIVLQSVVMPESLRKICKSAFSVCVSLKTVQLNEGLLIIDGNAFDYCERISEITIPSSVIVIGGGAFWGCKELCKVTNLSELSLLPDGSEFGVLCNPVIVDKDGNIFGEDVNNQRIIVDDENGFRFEFRNGTYRLIDYIGLEDTVRVPDNYNGNDIEIYFNSNLVKTIIVPGTLHETGIYTPLSYRDTGVKNVIIEDGVKEISDFAFYSNEKLVKAEISDSVEHIGWNAFLCCTSLEEVYIGKNVQTIGGNSFERCSSLKKFTVDPENPYLSYRDGVLYNADKTKILAVLPALVPEKLVLPDTLTEIPNDAFVTSELKEVVIPEGVTKIGSYAFAYCGNLEKISLPSTLEFIDYYAFTDCIIKEIELPDNLKCLDRRQFRSCKKLETIKIGKNTENIDTSAFSDCPSIKEVVISKENTHLIYEDGFFYSSDKTIMTGAIPTCVGSVVVIPDTVKEIPINTFIEADITEIVLPAELETLKEPDIYGLFDLYTTESYNIFSNCYSLKKISLDENNTHFKVIDNVLYDNHVTKILSIAKADSGIVNVPEGMTEIPDYLFSGCSAITKIVLPDTVIKIGDYAFLECSSMTEIEIPDSVTEIGEGAFSRSGLVTVKLPSSLEIIKPRTFDNCATLRSVKFNADLKEIGEYAFSYCLCLIDPEIPDSVITIGRHAFEECRSLMKVTLPASLSYIGDQTFYIWDSYQLYEVVNNSDIDLFSGADYGFNSLRVLIDKNGNKTYTDGWEGFEFTDTAEGFRFYKEDGKNILVAYIGDEDDVTLPHSFNGESYELNRFRGGKRITVEDSVENFYGPEFSYYAGIESIIFGKGVKRAGTGDLCVSIRSVTFGDDVELIAGFCDCPLLTEVIVPDKILEVEAGAFLNTPYSEMPENNEDGVFYVGRNLVRTGRDVEYFNIRPDTLTISREAYRNSSRIKKVYNFFNNAFNAEILVLYDYDITFDFDLAIDAPDTLKSIVISENSKVKSNEAFEMLTGISIFVEKQEKDCRWDEVYPGWNNGNKVYYGDEWNWATFRTADGECVLSVPVKNAEVLRIPPLDDDVKGEYTDKLIGWDIDGDGICDSVPAVIYDDLTAVAVRELKKSEFTIRFFDDDRRIVIYEYVSGYGESLILPPDPVRRGYTFAGWIGGGFYNPISENMVYFAEWKHDGDGHEYTISRVEPTCTEQGYDLHVCSICGESYKTDFTEPTGHTYGEWITDRAATCTVAGLRHRECACGRVEEETINTTPHDFTAITTKQPTCSETGIISYKCNDCGFETTDVIPVSPHSYDKKYITEEFYGQLKSLSANVICISDKEGLFCYECSVCHRLAEEDEEDDLYSYSMKAQSIGCSHVSGMWKTEKEPTDSDPGTNVLRCSKCGDVLDIKLITEKGHTYNNAPAWSWSDDHLSAKALFACATCDDVLEIDADVSAVSDNISTVYTATVKFNGKTYTSDEITVYIEYTVKFVDYDDTVISENTYHYGDNVTVPNDPIRAEDETYTYTFAGWDKEIKTVTENVTYTATYDKKEKEQPQFMLGDINGDGKTNNKDVVALFRYVSSGNGNVVIAALDTNGDGKLNNKDVVTLFRYVSNNNNPISTKPYDPNAKVIITAIIPDRTKVH